MKVRAKITAVVLFVALVPTGVVAWTTLRVHQDAYDAQREELQLGAARSGAALLQAILRDQRRGLGGVVRFSTDWTSLTPEEREGAVWLVYSQLEEVAAVAVFDGNDRLLESLAVIEPGDAEPEWAARTRLRAEEVPGLFQGLPLQEARRVGSARGLVVELDGAELMPLLFASDPGATSDRVWVVAAAVSLEPICRQLVNQRPPDTHLAVFDPDGHSRCAAQAGVNVGRIRHASVATVDQGMIEVEEEAGTLVAAVAHTPDGWTVVIEQPKAQALAAGRTILMQSLLWLGLGVGGALFAGAYMARGVTTPLRRIEDAAHRVAAGDFDHTLELETRDELGQVAHAFNTMSREIRSWNEELRDRVEDGTRDLRAAQDQLVEARKQGAMASLTAGISHEINNPLTSVLAFAQILLLDARNANSKGRQVELLETLEHEANRIRDLVQKMQALSEQRSGMRPVTVPMSQVLTAACDKLESRLREDSIELTREDDPGVGAVLGNPEQLETVVANLLENAVLSMSGERRRIKVRLHAVGDEVVVLEVADNGKGIAKENLDRVFDPFFTTKDNWRGVGLGLSLAHRIVSEHHGTITVQSEEGVGTTFRVTLPTPPAKAHLV